MTKINPGLKNALIGIVSIISAKIIYNKFFRPSNEIEEDTTKYPFDNNPDSNANKGIDLDNLK